MNSDLERPWLVAAWPGMGAVAQIAGTYLVQKLEAEQMSEIPAQEFFDPQSVPVRSGIMQQAALPKNLFFGWKNPTGGRDLVVFLGEKQPGQQGYRYCEKLIDTAMDLQVERVFTFAAMATPIHPESDPRVFGACTEQEMLESARESGVEVLGEGEISGLNGVFVSLAALRGFRGACLLGEFPYFASAVPNPKASAAVLRVFSRMSGIDLDLSDIDSQARAMEQNLTQLLNQLQQAAGKQSEEEPSEFEMSARSGGEEPQEEQEGGGEQRPPLDPEAQARIEALFEQARKDRSKALELKAELDRHGLFKEYEDRFLDLFKRGE